MKLSAADAAVSCSGPKSWTGGQTFPSTRPEQNGNVNHSLDVSLRADSLVIVCSRKQFNTASADLDVSSGNVMKCKDFASPA